MPKVNIFVVGMDELNRETLQGLDADYRFHTLLDKEQLLGEDIPDMSRILEEARRRLREFSGSVDAIIGYWDFPVSSMVPILCAEYGLPAPDLAAVVTCEHKYWSRLEQRQVAAEACPRFAIIELDGQDELPDELTYPVWLKPVKSASSELAFRVEGPDELSDAMDEIRAGIEKFGEPFEFVMDRIDPPAQVSDVGATACLAEEAVEGRQFTVEGFEFGGDIEIYGVIDSVTYPDSPSFLRYQYPSRLPDTVMEHVVSVSQRVVERIGLRSSTFNIEYFWDPATDRLSILEINPRLSQSHARLFEMVDGAPNHEILVRIALDRVPDFPHREGPYATAAKWFVRRFEDATVVRVPSPREVSRAESEFDGVTVALGVDGGEVLSEMPQQDSYSYEVANLFVGAGDESELIAKYEQALEKLPFDYEEETTG